MALRLSDKANFAVVVFFVIVLLHELLHPVVGLLLRGKVFGKPNGGRSIPRRRCCHSGANILSLASH